MNIISIKFSNKTLHFTLFDMADERVVATGVFERIGMPNSYYTVSYNGEKITEEIVFTDCFEVAKILLDKLISLEIISSIQDIKGIGYFIFHGKDQFYKSIFLRENDIHELENFQDFVPSFIQDNISGVRAFQKIFVDVPVIGVFDTAFYGSITEDNYLYSIPRRWYIDYGIRKYGFYGITHRYIRNYVGDLLNKGNFKLISCYIDSEDVSISAIKDGKCIDTSMGFSLSSGAMMGTSCGDIDPSIIPYIMEKEGKNASEVIDDLNYGSGLLGLSEVTNDIESIISLCEEGDQKAILAKNKFVRRIVDYIAQYYVLLGGADAIVFTGEALEKLVSLRREICEKLSSLGVKINLDANIIPQKDEKISADDSSVLIYVIPAREDLMIARDTLKVLNG